MIEFLVGFLLAKLLSGPGRKLTKKEKKALKEYFANPSTGAMGSISPTGSTGPIRNL